jgi:hypothetical protein
LEMKVNTMDRLPPLAKTKSSADPRTMAAWRTWLAALASDPEAVMAAADIYACLDDQGRTAWLEALEVDAPKLNVPKIALYAPLLAVETDPIRLARMEMALGAELPSTQPGITQAFRGVADDFSRVVVLVLPRYLSFVQVLLCRFSVADGFVWALREALLTHEDAPSHGTVIEGVRLEQTPVNPVIEELALAVLAQKRKGEPPPEALRLLSDIFAPHLDEASELYL